MSRLPTVRALAAPLLALALASCGGGGGPTGPVPTEELIFLRNLPGAPPLERTEVSFWAVAGDNAEVEIRYAPTPDDPDGDEWLEFKVPGNGLLRRPDGRAFARGDSVRITIRVVDPEVFNFEFEPAGLVFDPDHPAELEVSFRYADPDYDGDGDEDEDDEEVDRTFGFWRQEAPGSPWRSIGTVRIDDLEEAEAEIERFSRYALAGGRR